MADDNTVADDEDTSGNSVEPGFKSAVQGAGGRPARSSKSQPALVLQPWKKKLLDQRAAANEASSSILNASTSREQQARERLVRLKAQAQRELTRAASLAAVEHKRERKRAAVAEVRAESDRLVGKDLSSVFADVVMPSEEEVLALSKRFNAQLNTFDPDARTFYSLFKFMDIDGSRRISFHELENLVRNSLRIQESELDQQKLYGLWKVLDENNSGFIDCGELSRFLRIGQTKQPTRAQLAVMKLKSQREQRMQMIREESRKHLAKDVSERSKQVERATEEEVLKFGELFSKKRSAAINNFFTLFKAMDVDGSGHVKFEEVRLQHLCAARLTACTSCLEFRVCARPTHPSVSCRARHAHLFTLLTSQLTKPWQFDRMVRHTLKVSKTELNNTKLWALWSAIDENGNGFICAGEVREPQPQASAAPLDLGF